MLALLPGTNPPTGFQAIGAGHLHVHQYQVERLTGEPLDRRLAIGDRGHLMAQTLQVEHQQLQVLCHIVSRQNPQRRQARGLAALTRALDTLAGRQRQFDDEAAAHAQLALDTNAPAHQLHQLARDGGAQAGAAETPAHRGIGLGEGIEDAFEAIGGDADAGVVHDQAQRARRAAHLQTHRTALGELHRIAQQIAQHLLQAQRVTLEVVAQRLGVVETQLEALALGRQPLGIADLLTQLAQREIQAFQLDGAAIQLGGVENVVEQAEQRARSLLHGTQVAALGLFQRGIEQQLGEADDGVHRRADLVAHVGQEAAPCGSGLLGAVTRGAQLLLHEPARGQVGGQFDHLERLAVEIEDRVVGRLDPHLAPILGQAPVFALAEVAPPQVAPEAAVGLALDVRGVAEQRVMLAEHLVQAIAEQVEEVFVGRQHIALQIELDHGHGLADGRDLAFVLGIALLGFGLVEQHAVDPARHALFVEYGTAALPDPVLAPLAIEQPVLDDVVAPLGDGKTDLLRHPRHVIRVIQLGKRLAPADEVLGRPAGQRLHRIADEQHGPLGVQQAAERHAGNVANQRAVLLLAVTQGLFHLLALADVSDEHDEPGPAFVLADADAQAHRDQASVLGHAGELQLAAAELRRAAGHVALQRIAEGMRLLLGHQHRHVAPDQFIGPPAKEPFHRPADRTDDALVVDREDRLESGIQQRVEVMFAGLQLGEQLAIAQQAIHRTGRHAQGQGGHGHGQRQVEAAVDAARLGELLYTDETRRRHAGVVHAADGQAHDHPTDDDGRLAAHAPAQAETYPQGDDRQQHGHQDRQGKHPGVVTQQGRHLHRRHAAVVHGADAAADQHATDDQLQRADHAARQEAEGDPRRRQAGQHGQAGDHRVVAHRGAQLQGQHADEVHGPHAAAQRHRAGGQRQLPVQRAAADARHAGQLQRHARGEGCDDQRQHHQPGVIGAEQQQAGITIEKKQIDQVRHAAGDHPERGAIPQYRPKSDMQREWPLNSHRPASSSAICRAHEKARRSGLFHSWADQADSSTSSLLRRRT